MRNREWSDGVVVGLKGLLNIFRPSRKLALVFGGVLVFCGATGSAAVYIGAEKLLGPTFRGANGQKCTEVKTVLIKRKDRLWIRKYVSTNGGDGLSRMKTALRVVEKTFEEEKPDLVQVVVLDENGPKDRANMRGHAIGADVVYIPDPSRVPEVEGAAVFSARYIDRPANETGLFYGEKIVVPSEDAERIAASIDDKFDCSKPEGAAETTAAGHGGDAHAAPAEGGGHG